MSQDALPSRAVPDEVWYHLHQVLERRGWLGQVAELAGQLRATKYWLMVGVVATGSVVHVLDSITNCEPPSQSA